MSSKSSVIPVTSPALPPFEEFVEEIRDIWDSHVLTHQGPKYHLLEEAIRDYLSVANAPLFANGHLALQVAFWSLGLTSGEVITTPYTFSSTTQAIVGCGLTPVFCDIDPRTLCIDASKIEELITPKTKAIVGVHVYGTPCDVKAIEDIAKRHGLKVIYDAAHAFGETFDGVGIGNFGDISMFSMHATKVFNTVEGGCLTFNDDELYSVATAIRQFGCYGTDETQYVGTNAKLTELHAAMGLCNLRHIDESIARRKAAYRVYQAAFDAIPGIQTVYYPESLKPNYAYYPVLFDEEVFGKSRDQIADELEQRGIYARKYFYPLTSTFAVYGPMFEIQATPIAQKVSEQVLCLPLFADLSPDDAATISKIVLGNV
ncbi:MAG: DegT/DnrJ/EryC1/StrS family aminotransferase [Atopobiaceae bacterium]|nr:DegT/DnrJ/EryC1/StrS family aminotransferase [Atopobiaceae bacterium]